MSDLDEKLTEIRARHAIDQRWHGGPSMICPQSHEDRAFLLAEIERLRADRRERIATACLAGILANSSCEISSATFTGCAFDAVMFADALIARLDKESKP